MIWLFIFTPGYGLLNYHLQKLGLPNIEWLGDSRYALKALIIVGVWKYMGYYMLLLMAGLQNIPLELYEAGTLEGAIGWKKFRWITLPLLAPSLFFVFIMAIINSFQAVDQIYLMTRGGPANSTNMLVYYIYQNGFRFWDMGYASTLTSVLFGILLLITILSFGIINRRIHYS
jgi:ABC-type sugar transport system permease subunit